MTASQARVVSLVCIWTRTELTTHTQWSALCVLKWHKSFRTYDYSWGPTLCVTLSNIAAHISILTYFRHLSARSIEKAVVTFSMNRAFSAIVQKPLLSWLFWTVMHQNFSLKYDGAFIHGHGGFFEGFYISLLFIWYEVMQSPTVCATPIAIMGSVTVAWLNSPLGTPMGFVGH